MTVADLTAKISILEPLVVEHDKILVRGNGEPSLQEEVRNIKKFILDEEESRKFYSRLVIGAILTNLVAIGFVAFAWFVKIYPVLEQVSREMPK